MWIQNIKLATAVLWIVNSIIGYVRCNRGLDSGVDLRDMSTPVGCLCIWFVWGMVTVLQIRIQIVYCFLVLVSFECESPINMLQYAITGPEASLCSHGLLPAEFWDIAENYWHDDVFKGKHFRVTGHLCGEFTGHGWISRTKASDAELWSFLWSAPQ